VRLDDRRGHVGDLDVPGLGDLPQPVERLGGGAAKRVHQDALGLVHHHPGLGRLPQVQRGALGLAVDRGVAQGGAAERDQQFGHPDPARLQGPRAGAVHGQRDGHRPEQVHKRDAAPDAPLQGRAGVAGPPLVLQGVRAVHRLAGGQRLGPRPGARRVAELEQRGQVRVGGGQLDRLAVPPQRGGRPRAAGHLPGRQLGQPVQ
jgi:hypothetical protein